MNHKLQTNMFGGRVQCSFLFCNKAFCGKLVVARVLTYLLYIYEYMAVIVSSCLYMNEAPNKCSTVPSVLLAVLINVHSLSSARFDAYKQLFFCTVTAKNIKPCIKTFEVFFPLNWFICVNLDRLWWKFLNFQIQETFKPRYLRCSFPFYGHVSFFSFKGKKKYCGGSAEAAPVRNWANCEDVWRSRDHPTNAVHKVWSNKEVYSDTGALLKYILRI